MSRMAFVIYVALNFYLKKWSLITLYLYLGVASMKYQTARWLVATAIEAKGKRPLRSCLIKWFKHDSQAAQDAKLKKLRIKYGMEGYGLYWYCIELIATNVEADRLTFELEHDSEILSFDTGIHYERVQEMMAFMVKLGLFQNASGTITCMQLAKRADEYLTKAIRRLKLVDDKAEKKIVSGECPDKVRLEESRVDKIREEDNKKVKAPKRFAPPTLKEVQDYFLEKKGSPSEAERFVDFYESKGWMIGKNKMKSWQAAVRNWLRDSKETNQSAPSTKEIPEAERAWQYVIKMLRQHGRYAVEEVKNARVKAAVKAIGGWNTLSSTREENLHWVQKKFVTEFNKTGV